MACGTVGFVSYVPGHVVCPPSFDAWASLGSHLPVPFGLGIAPPCSCLPHPCVSAASLAPRSELPSLREIKVPLSTVQVPQKGSTVKSSGSTRFHIKVPHLKVEVPQGST